MNRRADSVGVLLCLALIFGLHGLAFVALASCTPTKQAFAGEPLGHLYPAASVDSSQTWTAAAEAAAELSRVTGRSFELRRLKGASMQPASPPAAWAIMERAPFADLSAGDFVVYLMPTGQAAAHRLLERGAFGRWWVKGDNNSEADRFSVTADNYVGRIVALFYEKREASK